MSGYTTQRAASGNAGTLKRILRYLLLLLIWWLLLWFVVIPWDKSGQIPEDSYDLIEGQRAYAELVRRQRPNLVTVLRGLNMVRAEYAHEAVPGGRMVSFGNIVMLFDEHGEFGSLRILHE